MQELREVALGGELPVVVRRPAQYPLAGRGSDKDILAKETVGGGRGADELAQSEAVESGLELGAAERAEALADDGWLTGVHGPDSLAPGHHAWRLFHRLAEVGGGDAHGALALIGHQPRPAAFHVADIARLGIVHLGVTLGP